MSFKTYIKTFEQCAVERQGVGGIWAQIQPPPGDLDQRVNTWVESEEVQLVDVKTSESIELLPTAELDGNTVRSRHRYTRLILIYTPLDDSHEPLLDQTVRSLKLAPLPLKEGAVAPTVNVILQEDGKERSASAMCGVFGVPEGQVIGLEDSESAPVPLFSPDLDLTRYRTLFGNIKEKVK